MNHRMTAYAGVAAASILLLGSIVDAEPVSNVNVDSEISIGLLIGEDPLDIDVTLDGGSFTGDVDAETGEVSGDISHASGSYPATAFNGSETVETTINGAGDINDIVGTIDEDGVFTGSANMTFNIQGLSVDGNEIPLGECPIPAPEIALTGTYDAEASELVIESADFGFGQIEDENACNGLAGNLINPAIAEGRGALRSTVTLDLQAPPPAETTTTTVAPEPTTVTTVPGATPPATPPAAAPIQGAPAYTG